MTDRLDQIHKYLETVPDHFCDPEKCDAPIGILFTMIQENDRADPRVSLVTHRVSPNDYLAAFLRTYDDLVLDSKPDDMPHLVAFAHGRELIRRVLERATPEVVEEMVKQIIDEGPEE